MGSKAQSCNNINIAPGAIELTVVRSPPKAPRNALGRCATHFRTGKGVMRVEIADILAGEQLYWHVDRWRSGPLVQDVKSEEKQTFSILLWKKGNRGDEPRVRKA
jgi:hypothetical protein